jgi:hypothetical protein
MSPRIPQAVPRRLIRTSDNDTDVILSDLVQTKNLDLLECLDQPAEVVRSGMIDVDFHRIGKETACVSSHFGCDLVHLHLDPRDKIVPQLFTR